MRRKAIKEVIHSSQDGSDASDIAIKRILRQLTPAAQAQEKEPLTPAIDADLVEELAFLGLDPAAIAHLLGSHETRITAEFGAALAHGRARRKQFLLRKLDDRIDSNEWPALRFALKNFCGMSDNPQQAALQQHKLARLRDQDAAAEPAQDEQSPRESLPVAEDGGEAEATPPSAAATLRKEIEPTPAPRLRPNPKARREP